MKDQLKIVHKSKNCSLSLEEGNCEQTAGQLLQVRTHGIGLSLLKMSDEASVQQEQSDCAGTRGAGVSTVSSTFMTFTKSVVVLIETQQLRHKMSRFTPINTRTQLLFDAARYQLSLVDFNNFCKNCLSNRGVQSIKNIHCSATNLKPSARSCIAFSQATKTVLMCKDINY